MKAKLLLISFILAFWSYGAYAAIYFHTGSSLMQGWREHQKIISSVAGEKDYLRASRFIGYVMGVADARSEALDIPMGVTQDQLCAIVGKYLESHPEEWNEIGSALVEKALRNAFRNKQ